MNKLICPECGYWGHDENNCWRNCSDFNDWSHSKKDCPTFKKQKNSARRKRIKLRKQADARDKDAANFKLDLPDKFDNDDPLTASIDDSTVTVVSLKTNDKEKTNSGSVMRVKEFVDSYTDLEVKEVIDSIKAAKDTDNSAQGLIYKNTDF